MGGPVTRRRPAASRPDGVLIDAGNLHSGGGLQAAASFLDELATVARRPASYTTYPWLRHLDVEASTRVLGSVSAASRDLLTPLVVDRRPKDTFSRRNGGYAVSFTIFGPEYGPRRARFRIQGFADSTVLGPPPEGVPRGGPAQRARMELRSRVSRTLFRRADELVVETAATRQALTRVLGLEPSSIHVVPNSVNGVFHQPDRWSIPPAALGLESSSPILTYITRHYPHKNVDFLGELALAMDRATGTSPVLLLTLSSSEWDRLAPLTRHYAFNVGPVSIEQVPPLYELSSAAVFPSLLESFSAMPIEAMTMGVPVFAADRDYVRTTCGDGPIYIDPLDPASAAATVSRFLADPRLLTRHISGGRAIASALPSAEERALDYMNIIDQAWKRQA